ncbi:MAG: Uma2 family endonuclease [Caldilineaceae bacterium]|nr:Uma2 family endonuclease [Caldilineaceae bacterium]
MAIPISTAEETNKTDQSTAIHSAGHANGHAAATQQGQPKATISPVDYAPDDGRRVSLEEYWAIWYEAEPSYEWNNGYLEVKPMPNVKQLRLFHWFLELMRQYIAVFQNAELMSLETGFPMRVPNPDQPGTLKDVVRKPDLAAILHTNPVTWEEHERSYRGTCDLCLEAISDSSLAEVLRDIKIKKSEYEFAGVQEYYILDPSGEHMHFYARNAAGLYIEMQPDAEGVIRSNVLPGFQFRYNDLKRQRSLETLALDDVYRDFVLLRYQAAEARAAAAEEQAAVAEKQVAAAEQQAARYAAKLRELGVDPDTISQ